jgi:glycosidase
MAKDTSTKLRQLFLYQVYVRNHTKEGTFKSFQKDLDRIKKLGVDIVYFLPIHPIGQLHKKGSLGCPYSIADYRAINPEYGTMNDFEATVKQIHDRSMKVMIDVVYNHTSHDSVLLQKHPEYFMRDEKGNLTSKEPGWSDIQDLDYKNNPQLEGELIDTLLFWMDKGVDGFRFDVASFLPKTFLEKMRSALKEKNPSVILLSESVHGHYLRHMRNRGFDVLSESEIYEIFDMSYDYDLHPYFEGYLKGEISLNRYLEEMLRQEMIYPANYVKLRNLENHDFGRFAPMVTNDPVRIDNWTAFIFFAKGATMIYAGQERCDMNQPSLFEKDDVNWHGRSIEPLIQTMASLTKRDICSEGIFDIHNIDKDVIVSSYIYNGTKMFGVFNISNALGTIATPIPDGTYLNQINKQEITIKNGLLTLSKDPVVIMIDEN